MSDIFKVLGLMLVGFITPIVPLLILVGLAILIDTIFGVVCAKVLGNEIKSRKLSRFVLKSIIYSLCLILFYGIDFYIVSEAVKTIFGVKFLLTKLVTIGLILLEMFSVDEKIRLMNNGKGFMHFIKLVIKRIKYFKREITKITEKVGKEDEDHEE